MQALELEQLFLRGCSLSLSTQSDAQVVMRFFVIGFELNRATECSNRAGQIASSFELHPEVEIRLRIVRSDLYCSAKLSQRPGVIAGAAQHFPEHQMCWRKTRIEANGFSNAAKGAVNLRSEERRGGKRVRGCG